MNKLKKIAEKRAKENLALEKGKNLVKDGDSEKDNGSVKNELTAVKKGKVEPLLSMFFQFEPKA